MIVIRHSVRKINGGEAEQSPKISFDWLLLATGFLGLVWNLGGLFEWLSRDWLGANFA